jgi:uncharacterized protein
MKFWDSSAIVPLCVQEQRSEIMLSLLRSDSQMVCWWATIVECWSAFARLRREGVFTLKEEETARELLFKLSESWTEVEATTELRQATGRILKLHPLRAADSLQLAAALTWTGMTPKKHGFVSLDERLLDSATREGFRVFP